MISILAGVALAACGDGGLTEGPVNLGFFQGALGAPRRACARTEISLAPSGRAIVETANFYGNISGGVVFNGSYALNRKTEVFGRIEPVHYESVIGAISSSAIGPGDTSLGLQQRLWHNEDGLVQGRAQVVFPTSFGLYQNAWPVGLDLGISGVWTPGPVEIGGSLLTLGSAAVSKGPTQARVGVSPAGYFGWRPTNGFEVLSDVRATFGYEATLDHFAVGGGVRFGLRHHFGTSLEVLTPVLGRDRSLAMAELTASWNFGS